MDELRQIHGHHIVQKNSNPYLAKKGTKSWYIQETQKILEGAKIDLLDDVSWTRELVNRGEKLYNLTLAVNGRGVHTKATVKYVYETLGSSGGNRSKVLEALADMNKTLMDYGTLLNPITMKPWY